MSTATRRPPLLLRSACGGADAAACVLGRVGYGCAPPVMGDALAVTLPVRTLPGLPSGYETWLARSPVARQSVGPVQYATDGELLFGHLTVAEREADGLAACAQRAYAAIFAALAASPCPHPLRFWNYVPRINDVTEGLERYRQFNIGRQQAFVAAGRSALEGAPAACALGTAAGALSMHFLAARRAPLPLENPRQVSAYRYPPEYGPRSPTFSRAALHWAADGGEVALFISGTAAIVGHRSLHAGDVAAQTRETMVNLRTMVEVANARLAQPAFALDRLHCTVYVRRPEDAATVRAEFEAAVGTDSPAARNAIYAQADVCRAELLVEIEATGVAASGDSVHLCAASPAPTHS